MKETEKARPAFDAKSLEALVERLNEDPSALHEDWRELIRQEFQLTPDQARSLETVSHERAQQIQDQLRSAARHVERGGRIDARIVKRPLEKQTATAVHEIQLEHKNGDDSGGYGTATRAAVQVSIVIAHCDAHCRNWGWGPG
jgi:hypothetical protein